MEWRPLEANRRLATQECAAFYVTRKFIRQLAIYIHTRMSILVIHPDYLLIAGRASIKALDKELLELQIVLSKSIRYKKMALG